MNLNNELVNRLVRLGESHPTFSLHPTIDEIIDSGGRLRQPGSRIPVLDAIRLMLHCSGWLAKGSIHPAHLTGVAVNRDVMEALVISLERVEDPQPDMLDPEPKKIALEIHDAKAAYEVASVISRTCSDDPRYTMDAYLKQMAASPNPTLSQDLLASSSSGNGGWISSQGTLAPLTTPFPRALAPSRHLEIQCHVRDVDESQGNALVEIVEYRRAYDRQMLVHHSARVKLAFDVDSMERDDLLAVQYHQCPVWLRVSASCATARVNSQHTRLTLSRVMMERSALDEWHAQARQKSFLFDGDGPPNPSR